MDKARVEIYYILLVAAAFLLGVAAGIYLIEKQYVTSDIYVYACLVASIIINLINLVFFQKRYLAFLKSLEPKFSLSSPQNQQQDHP